MMKRFITFAATATLLSIALAFGQSPAASDPLMSKGSFVFQGAEREFFTFVPDASAPGKPLVILLHGYGGDAAGYLPEFIDAAGRHGFAVCVPRGSVDTTGHRGWNVGYPMQKGLKVDDVAFVSALVDSVSARFGLDSDNAFLCGMSNGGEMCYYFAYRNPKRFRAISSVAGLTMAWIPETYKTRGRVPFMEIHGNGDTISLWEGDHQGAFGWGAYLGVEDAVGRIVKKDGCRPDGVELLPLLRGEDDPKGPSRQVTLYRYASPAKKCIFGKREACEVRLYKVEGGEHCWHLSDFDTCEETLKFFELFITSKD